MNNRLVLFATCKIMAGDVLSFVRKIVVDLVSVWAMFFVLIAALAVIFLTITFPGWLILRSFAGNAVTSYGEMLKYSHMGELLLATLVALLFYGFLILLAVWIRNAFSRAESKKTS